MKILILASNPRKDLNLDREIRDLKEVIEQSRNRQEFEVEDALAVRVGDLQDLLFKHEPQIVHFCGHGGGQPGLVFEGNHSGEQWVRTEALRDLFRLFASKVGCVLLNACYSEEQANEIVNHIDYVIGMNQEIRDDAAIAFSKGFYRALGYDCSVEEAYEFGCNAIQLEITGSSIVRSAATESLRKAVVVNAVATTIIPEHLKPTLKKKEGASSVTRWKSDARQPLSQGRKEELQLELAQELIGSSPAKALPDQSQINSSYAPILQPSQNSPNAPVSPRRRLTQLFVGGLIACLISAGGIYSYQQWQSNQLQQNPLQQAIDLANQEKWEAAIVTLNQIPANSTLATQSGGYLELWSSSLLSRARESYEKGDMDAALRDAQAIPKNSSIYQKAQAAIGDWNKDKQTLDKINKRLETDWDLAGSRRLLKEIKSPGLRKQAEDNIVEIEKKIPPPNPPVVTTQPDTPPPIKDLVVPRSDSSDYQYSWLSEQEVTQADLEGKSAFELSIMRNSIYARHGLIFQIPEIRSVFSKQSWYKPTSGKVDNLLSNLENKNVNKIKEFEKQMGYR